MKNFSIVLSTLSLLAVMAIAQVPAAPTTQPVPSPGLPTVAPNPVFCDNDKVYLAVPGRDGRSIIQYVCFDQNGDQSNSGMLFFAPALETPTRILPQGRFGMYVYSLNGWMGQYYGYPGYPPYMSEWALSSNAYVSQPNADRNGSNALDRKSTRL